MPRYLKTNTAVRIVVGPFLDCTDGVTPELALTVTACTAEIMHEHDDGSAPTRAAITLTASGGSNDMVHVHASDVGGYYDLELAQADVNFLGRAKFCITDSDVHLPVFEDWLVVPANVFDALMGTDLLDISMTQILGTLLTESAGAGKLAGALVKLLNVVTPTGTVNSLPDAVAGAANGLLISGSNAGTTTLGALTVTSGITGTLSTVTTLSTLPAAPSDWLAAAAVKADAVTKIQAGLATPTNITAAAGCALAASQHVIVDSGSVTSIPAAVLANSASHGGAAAVITLATPIVANATQIEGAAALAGINAQCDTACSDQLIAMNLDHLMKTAVGNNADMTTEITDGTVLSNVIAAGDTSTFVRASDGLRPIATDVAATHVHAAAADQIAGVISDTDIPLVMDALQEIIDIVCNIHDTDLPAVPDAVWNEALADHLVTGSTGEALNSAGGGLNITLGAIVASRNSASRISEPYRLEMHCNLSKTFALSCLDANGEVVDLTNRDLRFVLYNNQTPPSGVLQIDEGEGLEHSGSVATLFVESATFITAQEDLYWALLDVTATDHEEVLIWGQFKVFNCVLTSIGEE